MTLLLERPRRDARGALHGYAQHFLLEDVSWDYYLKTLDELEERHYRVTYDDGRMEIMAPPIGRLHEFGKKCIAHLIEMYAFSSGINITGLGQVTTVREDIKKGVEPDECYWVQTKPPEIGQSWLTLDDAPRPDLVVEVDITSGIIEREPIYAAFGVPELWRFRHPRVEVLRLDAKSRKYRRAVRSKVFPKLSIDKFNEFLWIALRGDQNAAITALQRWLQSQKRA